MQEHTNSNPDGPAESSTTLLSLRKASNFALRPEGGFQNHISGDSFFEARQCRAS